MFKRFEYKYLVPDSELDALRRDIIPFVAMDKYAKETGRGEYTVRSIYFDSVNFNSYFEKIEGIAVRKKFRVRGYNEPDINSRVFIEIKNKHDDFINKNRASIPLGCLETYLESGSLENFGGATVFNGGKHDAEKFMYYYRGKNLRPSALVVYEREAYMGVFEESLRITFDKNLRSRIFPSVDGLFSEEKLRPAMRSHFTLEFKFYGGAPSWFKFITRKYNLTRRALSKYTICIDSQVNMDIMRHYPYYKSIPYSGSLFKRNLI